MLNRRVVVATKELLSINIFTDTAATLGKQILGYEFQAAQNRTEIQELKRQLDAQTLTNRQLTGTGHLLLLFGFYIR